MMPKEHPLPLYREAFRHEDSVSPYLLALHVVLPIDKILVLLQIRYGHQLYLPYIIELFQLRNDLHPHILVPRGDDFNLGATRNFSWSCLNGFNIIASLAIQTGNTVQNTETVIDKEVNSKLLHAFAL